MFRKDLELLRSLTFSFELCPLLLNLRRYHTRVYNVIESYINN